MKEQNDSKDKNDMNILIFSGGSGPSSLQRGLVKNFPEANIKTILNAYDNGKSTGDIRLHFDGEILGPSDVRKNQSRMHSLETGKSNISNLVEHRFDASTPDEALKIFYDVLEREFVEEFRSEFKFIEKVILRFFDNVTTKTFSDYSIGNILYGQLARENRNSLQAAADIMKEVLNLKSSVILNSDESLFLKAKTENNVLLDCESKIVDWNSTDKITEVFLENAQGERVLPELSDSCVQEVLNADMIILSTGTQWSSLIPTYMSTYKNSTMKDILSESKATKYLIMNGKPDLDMINMDGDDILGVLDMYLNLNDFKIVSGKNYMKPKNVHVLLNTNEEKYDSDLLVKSIFSDYFQNPSTDDIFCFDWDGTIAVLPEPKALTSIISENKREIHKLNSTVISGNTHKVIDVTFPFYAEGGLIKHVRGKKLILSDEFSFSELEKNEIKNRLGENSSKMSSREDVCITIKPLLQKERIDLSNELKEFFPEYDIQLTGKTTIDIFKKNQSKSLAFDDFISEQDSSKRIFYVGDEIHDGNDSFINEHEQVIKIPVQSPVQTRLFLRSIRGNSL